jgi:ABC-type branched-subunit amino acid transport system ATPase component
MPALIETIKAIHAEGVTIIWIEHVLHALNSVVDRLLVLDFGKVIGIGEPGRDHGIQGSQRNLPGDRDLMALLDHHNLTAHYGDFQALFRRRYRLNEGETVAIIGANGAGKTTLMRSIAGVLINEPGSIHYDGNAIGNATCLRMRSWRWVCHGAGGAQAVSIIEWKRTC